MKVRVNHITTAEYPTKAKRPINSKMSKEKISKAGFNILRDWKFAIKDYLESL